MKRTLYIWLLDFAVSRLRRFPQAEGHALFARFDAGGQGEVCVVSGLSGRDVEILSRSAARMADRIYQKQAGSYLAHGSAQHPARRPGRGDDDE